jgi:hypothetical protein
VLRFNRGTFGHLEETAVAKEQVVSDQSDCGKHSNRSLKQLYQGNAKTI